jgi:hypothetical protein
MPNPVQIIHLGHGKVRVVEVSLYQDRSLAHPRVHQALRLKRRVLFDTRAQKPATRLHNGYKPGPLVELGLDQCKYTIHGDTMCGCKTMPHASWCEAHRAIVYQPRHAQGIRHMEAAE